MRETGDPNIAAIQATVRAGFRFQHLYSGGELEIVHGFRAAYGAMDLYYLRDADHAMAARFRLEDPDSPLWHARGAVAEVVPALLALPAHGSPGAPTLARRPPSELWLPHQSTRKD